MFSRLSDYIVTLKATLLMIVVVFFGGVLIAPWRLHRAKETELSAATQKAETLAARLAPKLGFAFDPPCCCLYEATEWAGLNRYCVGFAVVKFSGVQVIGAQAFLNNLDGQRMRLALRWTDRGEGEAKSLNPSNEHYHVAFVTNDAPTRYELDVGDPATGFDIALAAGPHTARVSVESANATPNEASLIFTVLHGGLIAMPRPAMTLTLEPIATVGTEAYRS